MSEKRSFVIDRSKWRCGGYRPWSRRGLGDTLLLNREGYMCCLGQVSLQLGCHRDDIFRIGYPDDVNPEHIHDVLVDDEGERTYLACKAINLNDNEQLDPDTREAHLTALFRECGYELAFIGEYAQE